MGIVFYLGGDLVSRMVYDSLTNMQTEKKRKRKQSEFATCADSKGGFFIDGLRVDEQRYKQKWAAKILSRDPLRFQKRFPKFVPKSER